MTHKHISKLLKNRIGWLRCDVSIRYSRFLQTALSAHVLSEQVRRQTEQLICPLLHQRQHANTKDIWFKRSRSSILTDWDWWCTNICWSDLITRTFATSSWKAMKFRYWMLTMSGPVTTVSIRFSIRPTRFPTSSSSRSFASWGRTAVNTSEWDRCHLISSMSCSTPAQTFNTSAQYHTRETIPSTGTSKKIEYHEKGQYVCHSFQKVKPIYYIDSLHIEWNISSLYFLTFWWLWLTDNKTPKFSVSEN